MNRAMREYGKSMERKHDEINVLNARIAELTHQVGRWNGLHGLEVLDVTGPNPIEGRAMSDVSFSDVGELKKYDVDNKGIIDRSVPFVKDTGIYFLLKGEEIVYVGQSTNIHSRVNTHTKDKDFDRVSILRCPREHMDVIETIFIQRHRPRFNFVYANNTMQVPIGNLDLFRIKERRKVMNELS